MTDDEKSKFLIKLKIGKKEGGRINNWFSVNESMFGELRGTECEKYPNGKQIQTSDIVSIHTIENEKILETRNSYYYLEEESSIDDYYAREASKENES